MCHKNNNGLVYTERGNEDEMGGGAMGVVAYNKGGGVYDALIENL